MKQWRDAMAPMRIAHIDPTCTPVVRVDGGVLTVSVRNARDTTNRDRRIDDLTVSCVKLTYFPGADLAQRWLAAAWAGYMQHEALELVFVGDRRALDPHESPRFDRGLRCGFPVELTPETLAAALALVEVPGAE